MNIDCASAVFVASSCLFLRSCDAPVPSPRQTKQSQPQLAGHSAAADGHRAHRSSVGTPLFLPPPPPSKLPRLPRMPPA
jgi:hypothetical protein